MRENLCNGAFDIQRGIFFFFLNSRIVSNKIHREIKREREKEREVYVRYVPIISYTIYCDI